MPALNRPRIAVTASIILRTLVYYREVPIAGVCFRTASSARHNGFVASFEVRLRASRKRPRPGQAEVVRRDARAKDDQRGPRKIGGDDPDSSRMPIRLGHTVALIEFRRGL
jgi:hypothetical protein